MKDITVRLYRIHDYDLLYLYKVIGLKMNQVMKLCLQAYVRKTPLSFKIPFSSQKSQDIDTKMHHAQLHIKLDETEDEDIIRFMGTLKNSYRNSFIKNLTRAYLQTPAVFPYYNDDPDSVSSRQVVFNQTYKPIRHWEDFYRQPKHQRKVIFQDVADVLENEGIPVSEKEYIVIDNPGKGR